MDFLKKHYEKVILSVVLIGLAVAAALLPMKVSQLEQTLEETRRVIFENPNPKKMKPLDMTNHIEVLERSAHYTGFVLSLPHLLVNPVKWEHSKEGPIKNDDERSKGAGALVATNLTPLNFIVSFVGGPDDSGRFQLSVLRQSDRKAQPRTTLLKLNERAGPFALREVRGPQEAPNELVIELVDEKRLITVAKDKPHSEPVAYTVDLHYPPENRTFLKQRRDDKLTLSRLAYKIIEINKTEVVLSEESTGIRTSISIAAPHN